MAIMRVTMSLEFMQVLRWYFVTGMLVDLSVAIMQVTVSVAIMQLEVSVAHMQVKFLQQIWEFLLQLCRWYFLQCIMHMTVSVVIVQVSLSFIAM